jgi:hypothetical protein
LTVYARVDVLARPLCLILTPDGMKRLFGIGAQRIKTPLRRQNTIPVLPVHKIAREQSGRTKTLQAARARRSDVLLTISAASPPLPAAALGSPDVTVSRSFPFRDEWLQRPTDMSRRNCGVS